MPTIDRTVTVRGDQQAIWTYLADFTTTEEWEPATRTTERVSGDGSVGTTYRNVSELFGRQVEATYRVVAHEPPHRLVLAGSAGSVNLLDTIVIDQQGELVNVHYRAEFRPQGITRLLTPLLSLGLKRLGDRAAERLDECLRRL